MPALDTMYGRYGHLGGYREDGSQRDYVDPRTLPSWLRDQYIQDQTAGDNSTGTAWHLGGGLRDSQGRSVIQLGDMSGDEGPIDRSLVRNDPDLGTVTDPSNVHRRQRITNREIVLTLAAMGAGGAALGAFAGAGAGAEGLAGAGADAFAGGAAGAEGSGAFAGGAAEGALGVDGAIGGTAGGASGASGGSSLGGMYGSAPGPGVVAPGMQGAANLDTMLINNGMSGMAGTSGAGMIGNAGQWAADNPMRAFQLAQMGGSIIGGLASNNGGPEGDNGPSELGSMGWKPPQMGPYSPAMYDPSYGSPFTGWQDQYQQSLKPLGRMYGNR